MYMTRNRLHESPMCVADSSEIPPPPPPPSARHSEKPPVSRPAKRARHAAKRPTLVSLPADTLVRVLSFLDMCEIERSRAVCRTLDRVVAHSAEYICQLWHTSGVVFDAHENGITGEAVRRIAARIVSAGAIPHSARLFPPAADAAPMCCSGCGSGFRPGRDTDPACAHIECPACGPMRPHWVEVGAVIPSAVVLAHAPWWEQLKVSSTEHVMAWELTPGKESPSSRLRTLEVVVSHAPTRTRHEAACDEPAERRFPQLRHLLVRSARLPGRTLLSTRLRRLDLKVQMLRAGDLAALICGCPLLEHLDVEAAYSDARLSDACIALRQRDGGVGERLTHVALRGISVDSDAGNFRHAESSLAWDSAGYGAFRGVTNLVYSNNSSSERPLDADGARFLSRVFPSALRVNVGHLRCRNLVAVILNVNRHMPSVRHLLLDYNVDGYARSPDEFRPPNVLSELAQRRHASGGGLRTVVMRALCGRLRRPTSDGSVCGGGYPAPERNLELAATLVVLLPELERMIIGGHAVYVRADLAALKEPGRLPGDRRDYRLKDPGVVLRQTSRAGALYGVYADAIRWSPRASLGLLDATLRAALLVHLSQSSISPTRRSPEVDMAAALDVVSTVKLAISGQILQSLAYRARNSGPGGALAPLASAFSSLYHATL